MNNCDSANLIGSFRYERRRGKSGGIWRSGCGWGGQVSRATLKDCAWSEASQHALCPQGGTETDTHTSLKYTTFPVANKHIKFGSLSASFSFSLLSPYLPLLPSPLFSCSSSSPLPSHPQVKARDQNAQVSGYLMVHTSKTRRWKRKWFVVYNLVLYEFERHEVQ